MRRHFTALAVAVVLVLVGYSVFSAVHHGTPLHVAAPPPEGCTARVESRVVFVTTTQAENASVIAAVATRRELPARAASIALAAAYQESGLENLDYGDSDSLGLFQQRPSQGWGEPRQLMNPYYAANAFYDALVRIPSYSTMDITAAAQSVQRSAYPTAYAVHEQNGRDLASALTGNSPAAFSCIVDRQHLAPQRIGADGLTPRADAVRTVLLRAYGDLPTRGYGGRASAAGKPATQKARGRSFAVAFSPWGAGNRIRAWAVAQFLAANAARLHVRQIVVDGHVWTAGPASSTGWAETRSSRAGTADLAAVTHPRGAVTVTVW